MPPRAVAKRSARRIIEDDESDEILDDEQYDDEEEDEGQPDEGDEDDEVDELDEDEELNYEATMNAGPSKTGLKIKLNVNASKIKAGTTSASTPGEMSPFPMPRVKRTNKRRTVVASEDEEVEIQDEDEEDEDAFLTSAPPPSQPARMTARQAALAGGGGPVEHVSLEEPPNPRKRKWTEEELALRREEAARKRKLKGAQRQEDEKQMIINRLINKGTGKRGRWASKAKDPSPEGDEEAEDGAATGAAGEGTEAGEGNESTSNADEEPIGAVTPAKTRGGWRGRGRRGRGAKLPPPPVRMHIPVMRWLSGMRNITIAGPDEPIQVDATDLEPGKDAETTSATATAQDPDQSKPKFERETYISFSIPPELISSTAIPEPAPPPASKPTPKCAIKGCDLVRKYKLIGSPDPEVGACGMAHLDALQSVH